MDEIFKLQNRCARIILDAMFQARTLQPFLELEWLWHQLNLYWKKTTYAIKQNPGRTCTDYLSDKLLPLKHHKVSVALSPYPRTNSMKRVFFYHAFKLQRQWLRPLPWCKEDHKKLLWFSREKFTPDSLKIGGIF